MLVVRRVKNTLLRCFQCNAMTTCIAVAFIITIGMVLVSKPEFMDEAIDGFVPFSRMDLTTKRDGPFYPSCVNTQDYLLDPSYTKQNASFIMLTRNEELEDVIKTINSIEEHFNQWFHYPYVFLNDVPFEKQFKATVKAAIVGADVEFGTISEVSWNFPSNVKETFEFHNAIEDQGDRGVLYGNMESYHKMCRFYSGLFYKHPLMQKFEWYWRLEPDVEFFCDITYDPFWEMHQNGKKYGFSIIIPELYWTVPNLFRYTKSFIRHQGVKLGSLWKLFTKDYHIFESDDAELQDWINNGADSKAKVSEKIAIKQLLKKGNEAQKINDDKEGIMNLINKARSKKHIVEDKFFGEEYNLCHFWSNFEIARLNVFDNEIYNSFFQYLEESGGFWKERWGDAPVHSIGLSLTLDLDDVHYFRDIGYRHSTIQHCPRNAVESDVFSYVTEDPRFKRKNTAYDEGRNYGCGCRCICPKYKREIEDSSGFCINIWINLLNEERGHERQDEVLDGNEMERLVREDYLKEFGN
ncbi:ktr5p [Saccharomyces arboricola H-6]|uniref:Ktr5p n=1 Tax=Saccharomyces arboricola (strain H-6 / AS 2.3317 / CBS 10644) TaxID=1160507 RepID=J8PII0_SACAR|nr:ktr5p [Saccharomyces arboricola H-6]